MRLLFAGPASLLALAVTLAAIPAQAAYTVTFAEVGSDVVASGSIDLAGLSLLTSGTTVPQVAPTFATEATGAAGAVEEYGGASGPTSLGPGVITNATAGTGDLVGIQQLISEPTGFVFVPTGYASKASLSDTATYAGQSFATLGLTPGQLSLHLRLRRGCGHVHGRCWRPGPRARQPGTLRRRRPWPDRPSPPCRATLVCLKPPEPSDQPSRAEPSVQHRARLSPFTLRDAVRRRSPKICPAAPFPLTATLRAAALAEKRRSRNRRFG